jgi:hypothetical protein
MIAHALDYYRAHLVGCTIAGCSILIGYVAWTAVYFARKAWGR